MKVHFDSVEKKFENVDLKPNGSMWKVRNTYNNSKAIILVIKISSDFYVSIGQDCLNSKVGWNSKWFKSWEILEELGDGSKITIEL